MAQNPSALKRQKELARLEWQREKAEKKKQRKLDKEQGKVFGGDEETPAPEGEQPKSV